MKQVDLKDISSLSFIIKSIMEILLSKIYSDIFFVVCEEGPGLCAHLLTLFSFLLIIATLPFSLMFVVKVVQVKITDLISLVTPTLIASFCTLYERPQRP